MALLKETTTKQGFTANYWRVDILTVNKHTKEVSCILCLYKNEETATSPDAVIENRVVTSYANDESLGNTEDLFEQYFGKNTEYADQYEACYNMAKDLDTFFADAEDC